MRNTWDIFCKVVDNYGDVGVAWRLARQLAKEYPFTIRLWVDDLAAFNHLWPSIKPGAESQYCEGVEVRAWTEPFQAVTPAEVVIEAFGCTLPETYLKAMCAQNRAPVWINLEYLSAEAWVKTHHALLSPHPTLPLTKFFFFPGYEMGTGGVLCERDLASRREHFLQKEIDSFWHDQGLEKPMPAELRISMFAYENAALPGLLNAWSESRQQVTCLIPEGRLVPQLAAWFGEPALPVGSIRRRGQLECRVLPFLKQDDYDRLLWACDLNFVRGEDSCVRAQWAQKPFVWQAYPQAENAHWPKLDALNQRYVQTLSQAPAEAMTELWRAWNGRGDIASAWSHFLQSRSVMASHAETWTHCLAEPGDLAANLVAFVEAR